MSGSGWYDSAKRCVTLCAALLVLGCETDKPSGAQIGPARRATEVAAARLADSPPPQEVRDVPVRPAGPAETQPAEPFEVIDEQVPDPLVLLDTIVAELDRIPAKLEQVQAELEQSDLSPVRRQVLLEERSDLLERQTAYPELIRRLETIHRPDVVHLSLTEAVRRAVLNSHVIQVAAYAPAIETARVVEAEAQFDAVFFTDFNYDKQNRPAASQLSGTDTQTRVWTTGIRKLLSSGMQAQTGYAVTRSQTDLIFQTLNPSYFNQLFLEFRQPLLRGFGLDFNRAQIKLRKFDRSISDEQLRREMRETIYNVEQAYWRLFQSRRSLAVSARLVTNLESILRSLRQRHEMRFDVYHVQLKLTESRYEQRQAEFVRLRNQVHNAEDTLKALINDPELNLARDLEIIPSDEPTISPLMVDVLGEVTAALSFRSELREARLQIEQAQVAIGVAKNQALPRLDVVFRYVIDGLGGNWDRAFSQLTDKDFEEYLLQIQFEWPIGNRGPEAALRQARLRQAQAIAAHRAQIENVVLETQTAIRDLHSAHDQIGPSFRSAKASAEQLLVTQLRQERRDVASLQVELDAHELLSTSRQNLLQALADHNIAIVNLERRKGTLLEYNNILLNAVHDDRELEAYGPVGP